MQPDPRFRRQHKEFWANVRTISEARGYTGRGSRQVKVHTLAEMVTAMETLGLNVHHLIRNGTPTKMGTLLHLYFAYRARVLNTYVEPRLMDAGRARDTFRTLNEKYSPGCPIPMNKQKGDKAAPAYLTGIVNMMIEAHCQGLDCDFDPRGLTTFTKNGVPLRTLARRVDGCFTSIVNPIAVWEIRSIITPRHLGPVWQVGSTSHCWMGLSLRSCWITRESTYSTCSL